MRQAGERGVGAGERQAELPFGPGQAEFAGPVGKGEGDVVEGTCLVCGGGLFVWRAAGGWSCLVCGRVAPVGTGGPGGARLAGERDRRGRA